MNLVFDYQLKCRSIFLTPERTNRITSHEGMRPQQALTDFFSKWHTLFANVNVPCSSLASKSCIDVSNLSEESSVSSDYNSYLMGIHFLLLCRQLRMDDIHSLSFNTWLYHIVSSNRSFCHTLQNNLTTGGFPPKHPMIDLPDNIFCPHNRCPGTHLS